MSILFLSSKKMSLLAGLPMTQNVIPNDVMIPMIPQTNPMDEVLEKISSDSNYENIKEHQMRAASGSLQSLYLVSLAPFRLQVDKLENETFELVNIIKKSFGNDTVFANVQAAQTKIRRLKNFLQNVCGRSKNRNRDKRFISVLFFFIFTTLAVAGISTAVGYSSRLITKEDIQTANETSIEKLQLNNAEIKRLEKNSKRLDTLEDRYDDIELKTAINKNAQHIDQTAEADFKELESLLEPERVTSEASYFIKEMVFDIRKFYASTNNDLFEHVVGTGVSQVFFFTSFQTVVLQDGNTDSCDNGHVMIVANTINPNMDIVGTKTKEPQTYETKDGRHFYIKKDFIIDGSPFRPAESLSSQRLIITSKQISVTVLNNTFFVIYNNELNLNIQITCPGKNVSQETLYKNPFLKLNTSCELSSEHLNISTFTQDYQQDELTENIHSLTLENIDEKFDFDIGYHTRLIEDKNDISEMYEKANDIFIKETEILQHEMKKLEEEKSLWKLLEKAGGAVSGWFNKSLHVIVGAIAFGAVIFMVILVLAIIIKCCGCCAKKKSCQTQIEAPKPSVKTNQKEEKKMLVM